MDPKLDNTNPGRGPDDKAPCNSVMRTPGGCLLSTPRTLRIWTGLERTRINLKENLTLTYKRTFFVRLPDDVSRRLGLNLRVYVAIKRRHPLAEDRDVFL